VQQKPEDVKDSQMRGRSILQITRAMEKLGLNKTRKHTAEVKVDQTGLRGKGEHYSGELKGYFWSSSTQKGATGAQMIYIDKEGRRKDQRPETKSQKKDRKGE